MFNNSTRNSVPGGNNPIYDRTAPPSLSGSPGNQNYTQRSNFYPTGGYYSPRPARDCQWPRPTASVDNTSNMRSQTNFNALHGHNNQASYPRFQTNFHPQHSMAYNVQQQALPSHHTQFGLFLPGVPYQNFVPNHQIYSDIPQFDMVSHQSFHPSIPPQQQDASSPQKASSQPVRVSDPHTHSEIDVKQLAKSNPSSSQVDSTAKAKTTNSGGVAQEFLCHAAKSSANIRSKSAASVSSVKEEEANSGKSGVKSVIDGQQTSDYKVVGDSSSSIDKESVKIEQIMSRDIGDCKSEEAVGKSADIQSVTVAAVCADKLSDAAAPVEDKVLQVASIKLKEPQVAPNELKEPQVDAVEPKESQIAPVEPKESQIALVEPKESQIAPVEPKESQIAPVEPKESQIAPVEPKESQIAPVEPKESQIAPVEPKESQIDVVDVKASEKVETPTKQLDSTSNGNTLDQDISEKISQKEPALKVEVPEKKAASEEAPAKKNAEEVPEKKSAPEEASEKKTASEEAPEKKTASEEAPEKKTASEKEASEKKTASEEALEKKTVLKEELSAPEEANPIVQNKVSETVAPAAVVVKDEIIEANSAKVETSKINKEVETPASADESHPADNDSLQVETVEDDKENILEDSGDEINDKKTYERSFILALKEHPLSRQKPEGLERSIPREMMKSEQTFNHSSNNHSGQGNDFTPDFYMRSDREHHGRQNRQYRNTRPHNNHNNHNQKMSYRSREVELNKSSNAWMMRKKEIKSGEDAETEETYRSIRAILNKLTPQKFHPLMEKVKALNIKTHERLIGVTKIIFEKALDEPGFSEGYANMCCTMSKELEEDARVFFRKTLLSICQTEFERDPDLEKREKIIELRQKMKDAEEKADEKLKMRLKEELEEELAKHRRRVLGNIRFVGELFNLSMLKETVLNLCCKKLLRYKTSDSLESLCRLLTTCGCNLEKRIKNPKDAVEKRVQSEIKNIFISLKQISDDTSFSNRARFMIKDLLDLRADKWKQRATKATGPKTIDEIHQEHKIEKEKAALKAANALANQSAKNNQRMRGPPGGGRHGSRNNHQNNDDSGSGWCKVQRSNNTTRYEPSKLRGFTKSSYNIEEESQTLAPKGGLTNWFRASASRSASQDSSSQRSDKNSQLRNKSQGMTNNRFSALRGPDKSGNNSGYPGDRQPTIQENRFSALRSDPTPEDFRRSSSRDGHKRVESGSTISMPDNRSSKKEAVEATRRITSYSKTRVSSTSTGPPSKYSGEQFDEKTFESKSAAVVKEFLFTENLKEAIESYEEFSNCHASGGSIFTKVAMKHVCSQAKSKDWVNLSLLLCKLLESRTIISSQFMKAAKQIATEAIDDVIDIPKIFEAFGHIVAPLIEKTDLTLNHLDEIAQYAKEDLDDYRLDLVIETLTVLAQSMGVLELKQKFQKSIEWSSFSSDMQIVKDRLAKKGLSQLFVSLSDDQVQIQFVIGLLEVVPKGTCSNPEDLVAKVRAKYNDEAETGSNNFIRALSVVCVWRAMFKEAKTAGDDLYLINCLKRQQSGDGCGTWGVDDTIITNTLLLLSKFVVNKEQQLEVLYAQQRLWNRLNNPQALLKTIFDAMNKNDLIEDKTYFLWEQSNIEKEGKGVALASVRSLIEWLHSDL